MRVFVFKEGDEIFECEAKDLFEAIEIAEMYNAVIIEEVNVNNKSLQS